MTSEESSDASECIDSSVDSVSVSEEDASSESLAEDMSDAASASTNDDASQWSFSDEESEGGNSEGAAAGVFEEGAVESQMLDSAGVVQLLECLRQSADDVCAINLVISILRQNFGQAEEVSVPFVFDKSVEDLVSPLECAMEVLQAHAAASGKRRLYMQLWTAIAGYLQAQKVPRGALAQTLLRNISGKLLDTLMIFRRKRRICKIWVSLATAALHIDAGPALISLMLQSPKLVSHPSRFYEIWHQLVTLIFRTYSVRRAPDGRLKIARELTLRLAVVCHQLQQQGQAELVYMALARTVKQAVLIVGQYMGMMSKPLSSLEARVKAQKQRISLLHDQAVSWGMLLLLSVIISVMVSEQLADSKVKPGDQYSAHNLAEAVLSILLALAKLKKDVIAYLPYQMKVVGLCLSLSRATRMFAPLGALICDLGETIKLCAHGARIPELGKSSKALTVLPKLDTALYIAEGHLANPALQTSLIRVFKDVLLDHLCHLAHHPAFPEVTEVLMSTATKKFSDAPELAQVVREVHVLVRSTAAQICTARATLTRAAALAVRDICVLPRAQYEALSLVQTAQKRPVNSAVFIH